MLVSPESTVFYLGDGQGYNLVVVIAGNPQQAVHAGGDDCQPPCGVFYSLLLPNQWCQGTKDCMCSQG